MRNHKDLLVWQKSVDLVERIYKITENFPKSELYSLTNQIRRAVVSVSSNIAEGSARQSDKEFIQFLYIALGSLAEIETQLIIAKRLGYIDNTGLGDVAEIRIMLIGLIRAVRNSEKQ